jgi:hypothetical protein
MPVLEAVQTFAGIANENEFYSHHYLAEVFKGDIKTAWTPGTRKKPNTPAMPQTTQHRAPQKRLQAWAQRWFALRGQVHRGKDEHERWQAFMQIQAGLLQALGYAPPPRTLRSTNWPQACRCPCGTCRAKRLAVIPAYQPSREDDDLLDHQLTASTTARALATAGQGRDLGRHVVEAVFGADQPPRYVLLLGLDQWLLLDRYKWPNNRALRFDWADILDRKDADTLKACAALLHQGQPGPRRRQQPAGEPGRKRPQARLWRQRRPEIRPARSHRTAGQRSRPPAR